MQTNLTEKESNLLKRIIESDFHDGADPINNAVWGVCESKSDNSVMGSLIKKELAGSQKDEDGITCWITQAGFDAYDAATNPLANIEEMEAAIDTAVDHLIECVEADQAQADAEVGEAPVTKAEKAPKKTSPRYERACYFVSECNKAFIAALEEAASLMGTTRVGEAIGIYSHPDIPQLDEDIRRCRAELEVLLERKRSLKPNVEGLAEVKEKVSFARRQRDKARIEKKAAAAELETA